MLTRRETLRGGTAAVAAIAAAGAVAGAAVPAVVHEPLLELERQWKAVQAEIGERDEWYDQQCRKLPAWARAEDGGNSGWPDISDLPEFEGTIGRDRLSKRPFPAEIEHYNYFAELMAKRDPERLAEVKAEGRARLRAWKARCHERDCLERELGIGDWDDQLKPLIDRISEIEREMTMTPALTLAGIAIKLRFWDDIEGPIEQEHIEKVPLNRGFVLSALRDIERMAGEARS